MFIQPHWNKVMRNSWPVKPRKHLRPSEIGMANLDRYLSMTGVEPSNEIPEKTLRIFSAGLWVEYIILEVFKAAGILKRSQEWLNLPETGEHLGIKGKLDAKIGGIPAEGWPKLEFMVLSQLDATKQTGGDTLILDKALNLIKGLREQFPDGMPEMLVEVKSIYGKALEDGSFDGYNHNKLQLYSYLVMSGIPDGVILYVSKDDFSVLEVPVSVDDADLRTAFLDDLKSITKYIRQQTAPEKEQEIIYNKKKGVFELNWAVSRSSYLTYIYGYKDADEFQEANHQKLLDINRALRHLRTGKVKSEDLEMIVQYNLEQYIGDTEQGSSEADA